MSFKQSQCSERTGQKEQADEQVLRKRLPGCFRVSVCLCLGSPKTPEGKGTHEKCTHWIGVLSVFVCVLFFLTISGGHR